MTNKFKPIVGLLLLVVLLVGLLAVLFVAFGRDPLRGLDSPDSLVLYSIDGNDYLPGKAPRTDETYYEYPVLGKVEITDPEKRKAIIEALRTGVAESDGVQNKCFWPRHAIRLSKGGKITDVLICFECKQLHIYIDKETKIETTTISPQNILNKLIEDADVPLAPMGPF